MSIQREVFGAAPDGSAVYLYTLMNSSGMRLKVTTFGGRMVQLYVPGRAGRLDDIIMGFDTLQPYMVRNPYFGALVGRCANRISNARFLLNGIWYELDRNAAPNHLHGGTGGFDKCVWRAEMIKNPERETLELTLCSPDGDQGYPGNLNVAVRYTLTEDNELCLSYRAFCDADTVINLTNHNYFNLAGHDSGNILNHRIRIDADAYTPTDAAHIPNGNICPVSGTPFDLRQPVRIGDRIHAFEEPQLAQSEGFDVNYVLRNYDGRMRCVAEVEEPESGRRMTVLTNQRALQFYTANYIHGNFIGKGGHAYPQHCGFCLETQGFPNSPNIPSFPPVLLHPGEEYRHDTVYAFAWGKGQS